MTASLVFDTLEFKTAWGNYQQPKGQSEWAWVALTYPSLHIWIQPYNRMFYVSYYKILDEYCEYRTLELYNCLTMSLSCEQAQSNTLS